MHTNPGLWLERLLGELGLVGLVSPTARHNLLLVYGAAGYIL